MLDNKLLPLEQAVSEAEEKNDRGRLKTLEVQRSKTRNELKDLEQTILKRERQRSVESLRIRHLMIEAEESLQKTKRLFTRRLEDTTAKRKALLEQLQHLETEQVAPSIRDTLHDWEHKLDALRRDVGELRRKLDRQTEPRK